MTEADKPECVFCDQGFPDYQLLVEHLIAYHRGVKLANGRRMHKNRSGKTVHCWCGRDLRHRGVPSGLSLDWYDPSDFARHLEKAGGLASHILEVVLGAKRPTRR